MIRWWWYEVDDDDDEENDEDGDDDDEKWGGGGGCTLFYYHYHHLILINIIPSLIQSPATIICNSTIVFDHYNDVSDRGTINLTSVTLNHICTRYAW